MSDQDSKSKSTSMEYPECVFPFYYRELFPPDLSQLLNVNEPTSTSQVLIDFIQKQNEFNQQVIYTINNLKTNLYTIEELLHGILTSNKEIAELATSSDWFTRNKAQQIIKIKKATGVVE